MLTTLTLLLMAAGTANAQTYYGTNPKWEISRDGTLTLYESTPDYLEAKDTPWYSYGEYFDKVVTASNVSYVGQFAFFNYPNLKSVSLFLANSLLPLRPIVAIPCSMLCTSASVILR